MIATTDEQKKNLRAAGMLLGRTLRELCVHAQPGITAAELDTMAERLIRQGGGVPSFLNYKPSGAAYPYPATLCVSINDEVVHGIPTKERVLARGDLVSLDLGLSFNGYFVDAARMVAVGGEDAGRRRLIAATQEALDSAIAAALPGNRIGAIGAAVARVAAQYNLSVVEDLGGHAVGAAVHERPYIANDAKESEGPEIVEGMVLALEPMFAEGKGAIVLDPDEWTYRTEDGSRATHIEDTILVSTKGAEIITRA